MFKKGDILQHKSDKDIFRKVLEIRNHVGIKIYKIMPLDGNRKPMLPESSEGISLGYKYINNEYELYKKSFFKVRRLE